MREPSASHAVRGAISMAPNAVQTVRACPERRQTWIGCGKELDSVASSNGGHLIADRQHVRLPLELDPDVGNLERRRPAKGDGAALVELPADEEAGEPAGGCAYDCQP